MNDANAMKSVETLETGSIRPLLFQAWRAMWWLWLVERFGPVRSFRGAFNRCEDILGQLHRRTKGTP